MEDTDAMNSLPERVMEYPESTPIRADDFPCPGIGVPPDRFVVRSGFHRAWSSDDRSMYPEPGQ